RRPVSGSVFDRRTNPSNRRPIWIPRTVRQATPDSVSQAYVGRSPATSPRTQANVGNRHATTARMRRSDTGAASPRRAPTAGYERADRADRQSLRRRSTASRAGPFWAPCVGKAGIVIVGMGSTGVFLVAALSFI